MSDWSSIANFTIPIWYMIMIWQCSVCCCNYVGKSVRREIWGKLMLKCRTMQAKSLDVVSVEPRGGRARCPYDPDSNYTIVYVGKRPLRLILQQFAMTTALHCLIVYQCSVIFGCLCKKSFFDRVKYYLLILPGSNTKTKAHSHYLVLDSALCMHRIPSSPAAAATCIIMTQY